MINFKQHKIYKSISLFSSESLVGFSNSSFTCSSSLFLVFLLPFLSFFSSSQEILIVTFTVTQSQSEISIGCSHVVLSFTFFIAFLSRLILNSSSNLLIMSFSVIDAYKFTQSVFDMNSKVFQFILSFCSIEA